jgi:hypothetical protein
MWTGSEVFREVRTGWDILIRDVERSGTGWKVTVHVMAQLRNETGGLGSYANFHTEVYRYTEHTDTGCQLDLIGEKPIPTRLTRSPSSSTETAYTPRRRPRPPRGTIRGAGRLIYGLG